MEEEEASSITIVSPQHSVEAAYTEWVIKAVEIIAQSRGASSLVEGLLTRQFALLIPERFNARQKVLSDAQSFFSANGRVVVDIFERRIVLVERWTISFDKDLLPTARRSERRDLTLPRRLAVALRSLLSLTKLAKPNAPIGDLDAVVREESEASTPRGSISGGFKFNVCSIPSSFGNLHLQVTTRDSFVAASSSGISTRDPTPIVTPARKVLNIKENYISNFRPQSVGGGATIEMVIEVKENTQVIVSRSAPPISKSPPRELSEIWPTSSLSYPVSPGRKASFDNQLDTECLASVPKLFVRSQSTLLVEHIFERPIPVSTITDQLDQLKRTRAKLFQRNIH